MTYYIVLKYYRELSKNYTFKIFVDRYYDKISDIINDKNELYNIFSELDDAFNKGFNYQENKQK